mmetsp:Transcript_29436/g.45166  ORF Transcript_29436/g.45166 Transcript_29436/m.45166 type:complete len:202 (-) Transcript_29436:590-1195(-)
MVAAACPALMAEFNSAVCAFCISLYSSKSTSNSLYSFRMASVSSILAVTALDCAPCPLLLLLSTVDTALSFSPSSSSSMAIISGSCPLIRAHTEIPNFFNAARSCKAPSQSMVPSSRTYKSVVVPSILSLADDESCDCVVVSFFGISTRISGNSILSNNEVLPLALSPFLVSVVSRSSTISITARRACKILIKSDLRCSGV